MTETPTHRDRARTGRWRPKRLCVLLTLLGILTLGSGAAAPAPAQEGPWTLLIAGGVVVDGTGAPPYPGDVALRGERIAAVHRREDGDDGLPPDRALRVIDASGLVVAPGFFDVHAHVQTAIADHPLAENFVRQGVTSIIASLHSGDQPDPFVPFLDRFRAAPNVGFFAGHTWTRKQVLGLEDRAPTAAELERMKALVDDTMRAGALGLSTGLVYVPANFAETEEVIELARVAARHGGLYVTHMRDEATGLLDSVREAIRIGREAGLPVQIQHHKVAGQTQWGLSVESLGLIDAARAEGLDVKHDLYPYTASSTRSDVLFPQWALAGGPEAFAARVADAGQRAHMERDMASIFRKERGGGDLARVQFRTVPSDHTLDGRTLEDLALRRELEPTIENGIDLVIELQLAGGFSAIYHAMDEADVVRIMRHPWSMFETDGDNVGHGIGFPHPRSYGTFARVLGHYVRERGVLTLPEAIRKMTSLPAEQFGQPERGRLAPGHFADITVFDAEMIIDRATFTEPHAYAVGVHHVIVNGQPVLREGALTGALPGRVLRGPARPSATSTP